MSATCKCSSCCETVNPFMLVGQLTFGALDGFIERMHGDSSSSSSVDLHCLTYEEFILLISSLIPAFDEEATDSDNPLIGSVFSPLTQIVSGWSAQALNDYCNGTGMDGYSPAQLNIIQRVLRGIPRVPPDSLPCYFSQWEKTVGESNLPTPDRNVLYISLSASKGIAYYWMKIAKDPGLWAPFMSSDFGSRWSNINYQVTAGFHGAVSVSSKSYKTPPVSTVADMVAGLMGSGTLTAATVILKATPGIEV